MTKFERWGVATIAASIVVVAAAGSSDSGKGEYQERREYVENLDENAKKELLEKRDRFLKLSPEEQEKLRRLHRAIQDHEDREELERVMEAYFDWVLSLHASERAQLNNESSPEERIKRVVRYKSSPSWGRRRHGGPGFPWSNIGGRSHERMILFGFFSKYADILKDWAGEYVAENREKLGELLPSEVRDRWEESVQQAASEGDRERALWRALVRWYLAAGPKVDLPLDQSAIEELKGQMPMGKPQSPISEVPVERQVQGLKDALRGFVFGNLLRDPDLRSVVTDKDLAEFNERHPGLREGAHDQEMADYMVRRGYIESRLGMDRFRLEGRSRGPGFPDGGRRGGSLGPGRGGPSGRGGVGGFGRPPEGPPQGPDGPKDGRPWGDRRDDRR